MYVNKYGELLKNSPDNFVKTDENFSVEEVWRVIVVEEADGVSNVLGTEEYSNEPTENQVRFCLSKYLSVNKYDTYADIRKIYHQVY